MENEFEKYLGSIKPVGDLVDLALDVLQEQWDDRLKEYVARRLLMKEEIGQLTSKIDGYLARIPKVSDEDLLETYEEEIKKLKANRKEKEIQLGKQQYTPEEFGTATNKVFSILKDPMSMWKSDDYNDKKTILSMYFDEQLEYDYERGFGTASLAYPVRLINEFGQAKNTSVEMSGSEPESE